MMPEHDPLAALPGLIEGPVAPRDAFIEELRARLLAELSAEQPDLEPAMREPAVITAPAVTLPLPVPRARRSMRRLLEIAAILALIVGMVAALVPDRLGNDTPPPTIDAVQGVPPVAMASPAVASDGTSGQVQGDALWQLPPRDDDPFFTDTMLSKGVIYRSIRGLSFMGVEAIDAATGKRLWEQATTIGGQIAADENGIYVVASALSTPEEMTGTPETITFLESPAATVIALDPATGAERWRATTGDVAASPIVHDGVLYVRDNPLYSIEAFDTTEAVHAIDTRDGSVIWSRVMGNPHRGVDLNPALSSMVVNDTTLAIVTTSGTLAVLDITTGEIRWHMQGFQLRTTDLALTGDGLVVAGYFQTPLRIPPQVPELSDPAGIIGLDLADGRVRWAINAGSSPPDLALAGLDLVAVVDVMPGSTEIAATPEAALDYGIIGIDPGVGQITWIATAGFGERPKLYPAADGSPLVALLDPDLVTLRFIDTEQGMLLSELLILNAPIALPPLIDGRVGDAYLSLKDGLLIAMRLDRGYALRTE